MSDCMGGSAAITNRILDRMLSAIERRMNDFLGIAEPERKTRAARESDERIDMLRARLGKAAAARRLIEREQSQRPREDNFDEKAEFAIRQGREDLARAAVSYKHALDERRLEIARTLAALDRESAMIEDALATLKEGADKDALKAKIDELDRLFSAEHPAANERN